MEEGELTYGENDRARKEELHPIDWCREKARERERLLSAVQFRKPSWRRWHLNYERNERLFNSIAVYIIGRV